MDDSAWIVFLAQRAPELSAKLVEHLFWLTFFPMGLAILIGVPCGIAITRARWLHGPVLGFVGIVQTIPSLAMLALLLALFGKIGKQPAIVALALYALLPIVRNTVTGIQGIAPALLEAANGLGFSRHQRLWWVELPLALPVIIAGVRTSTVICVGIATLSTFIGAGGLGDFINRGLALGNVRLVVLGAGVAAGLALLLDFALGLLEQWLAPGRKAPSLRWKTAALTALVAALAVAAFLVATATPHTRTSASQHRPTIRIGSKNFTEQILLGELLAQLVETDGRFQVERIFHLGGTVICHEALVNGAIDVYPEYTGTALTTILHSPIPEDVDRIPTIVREAYRERFAAHWLRSFGFNNTYAITVSEAQATARGWKTIGDLQPDAPTLRAGFTSEFRERTDGYPGLQQAYGFQFASVRDLGPEIMYAAVARNEVDVICAFATDGRIAAYQLRTLADDRRFFPPYHAAPVVRQAILDAHPELGPILDQLAGLIDEPTMQRLNFDVDESQRDPADVAREFLALSIVR
jgi:osmoprotectant transport system permease protein